MSPEVAGQVGRAWEYFSTISMKELINICKHYLCRPTSLLDCKSSFILISKKHSNRNFSSVLWKEKISTKALTTHRDFSKRKDYVRKVWKLKILPARVALLAFAQQRFWKCRGWGSEVKHGGDGAQQVTRLRLQGTKRLQLLCHVLDGRHLRAQREKEVLRGSRELEKILDSCISRSSNLRFNWFTLRRKNMTFKRWKISLKSVYNR